MNTEMWKQNLLAALNMAIKCQSTAEHAAHGQDFESAMVAGWKEIVEEIEPDKVTGIRFFDGQ